MLRYMRYSTWPAIIKCAPARKSKKKKKPFFDDA